MHGKPHKELGLSGTASPERKLTKSQTLSLPLIILSKQSGMLLSHTAPGRLNITGQSSLHMIALGTVI